MREFSGVIAAGVKPPCRFVSEQAIFTIHSPLGEIQRLGNTPYGERRIIDIHGGTVEGPKLKGKALPGGADWQIARLWRRASARRATPSRGTRATLWWSTARAIATARPR